MRIEIIEVTPEYAEHLLQHSAGLPQRTMMHRRIAAMAGAMARGQWKVTHQAIAIDPEGMLIDGQHRMAAVAMAGVPVRMTIAFDVPREAFDVIDTGSARTAASALHIAGYGDTNVTSAAARAVLLYDQIKGTTRTPSGDLRWAITTRDILDFLASERGERLRGNLTPARGIAVAVARLGMRTWLTAALTLLDDVAPDIQLKTEFVDRLHSGAMLAEASPMLSFRRWLLSDTGYDRTDRNYRPQVAIAATVKTWNAWIQGTPAGTFRFRPGRDVWPVVGEPLAGLGDLEAESDPEPAAALA